MIGGFLKIVIDRQWQNIYKYSVNCRVLHAAVCETSACTPFAPVGVQESD